MTSLWAERHHPLDESSLVIAKKKVGEVKDFLFEPQGRRLLILKGPPGAGKASVLRALCAQSFEMVEWSAEGRKNRQGDSITEEFLRFLSQADRYGSLGGRRVPRVSLVRDFPFALVESPQGEAVSGSQSFLQRFTAIVNGAPATQRLALCFNDTREETRILNKLLEAVKQQLVQHVLFDTVPRTFASRALERVLAAEGLASHPTATSALGAECGGDLRQAINALQLRFGGAQQIRGERASQASTKRRRGRAVESKPEAVQSVEDAHGLKSVNLGIFHALGRVLYCKRQRPGNDVDASFPAAKRKKPQGPPEPAQLPYELLVPKATRPPLYFVPEEVLEKSNTEPQIFLHWVFSNAPRFCGAVEDLANFAGTFAACDAWGRGGQEVEAQATQELATSVQLRSLLDANLHPIPPIHDPVATADSSTFNMVRPMLWDVQRHRVRRAEELRGHLQREGLAFGSPSVSRSLLTTTLPFVHRMMQRTRGDHAQLKQLPEGLRRLVIDLSADIDGAGLTNLKQNPKAPVSREEVSQPRWSALADDPIED